MRGEIPDSKLAVVEAFHFAAIVATFNRVPAFLGRDVVVKVNPVAWVAAHVEILTVSAQESISGNLEVVTAPATEPAAGEKGMIGSVNVKVLRVPEPVLRR